MFWVHLNYRVQCWEVLWVLWCGPPRGVVLVPLEYKGPMGVIWVLWYGPPRGGVLGALTGCTPRQPRGFRIIASNLNYFWLEKEVLSIGPLVWSTMGRCSGCTGTGRVYPSAAAWPHAADSGSASESRTPERDQKAPRIIIAPQILTCHPDILIQVTIYTTITW